MSNTAYATSPLDTASTIIGVIVGNVAAFAAFVFCVYSAHKTGNKLYAYFSLVAYLLTFLSIISAAQAAAWYGIPIHAFGMDFSIRTSLPSTCQEAKPDYGGYALPCQVDQFKAWSRSHHGTALTITGGTLAILILTGHLVARSEMARHLPRCSCCGANMPDDLVSRPGEVVECRDCLEKGVRGPR